MKSSVISLVVIYNIYIDRWLKVLPEPTKDVEPKGSLRIHSPDSANDKIELKMDNFWFKKRLEEYKG